MQALKQIIVLVLTVAILVPTLLCVILFIKIHQLEKTIEGLEGTISNVTVEDNEVAMAAVMDEAADKDNGELELSDESGQLDNTAAVQESAVKQKVYLTFDDGPSVNTGEILDILAEYNVRATFFVVGKPDEVYAPLYKRIVDEGHTIGMHSYSHKYDEIYQSEEAFLQDLQKLQEYIYGITGTWARIYRFPGGSSNGVSSVDMRELAKYLEQEDISYYDWNVSAGDAAAQTPSATQIANNVISGTGGLDTAVVLFHEGSNKAATVEALPIIIETLQNMDNVEILPITDETQKVQHIAIDEILQNGGN